MRRRIDLEAIYARAVPKIEPLRYGGQPSLPLPGTFPITIDALLTASCSRLEAAFPAAYPKGQHPVAGQYQRRRSQARS